MVLATAIVAAILFTNTAVSSSSYDNPEQDPGYNRAVPDSDHLQWSKEDLEAKWGVDWPFSGISTFAHLPHVRCLTQPEERYDIAIIGAPFDTAVSYRTGARFGPRAIRAASARQNPLRSFNQRAGINPYTYGLRVLDCGDIPVIPIDNALALKQMTIAFTQLGSRTPASASVNSASKADADKDKVNLKVDAFQHPKLITLGGDHSIALAALRGLKKVYNKPITVIHFDAHLDTWHPGKYPSAWPSEQASFNHGSMFYLASQEGLLSNRSVHAGLRTRLSDLGDYADDDSQGWLRISADDIDELKPNGIVEKIISRVGLSDDEPVYLSFDIDVIDPGLCPGTGTPEPGGWTSREVIAILRGLEDVNVVGADIVEVAPAYDGTGEQTALVAAQVVFEVLTSIVKRAVKKSAKGAGNPIVKDEL